MNVSVSPIPTILRTYTDGGEGRLRRRRHARRGDRRPREPAIRARDRLIEEPALHRFVNIYVNDEDVRFTGGLEAPIADGDNVTILPAVAGG